MTWPPLATSGEFDRVYYGVFEKAGRDPVIGRKLPSHFAAAGVGEPDGTDVAGLLAQRQAAAAQSRQAVSQQRQLDLQLALLGVGVLGENIEDHGRAVDHRPAHDLLKVALLGGRELVVEHDRVGVDGKTRRQQILSLALADEGGRLGSVAALHDAVGLVGAGGVDEQRQLVERRLDVVEIAGRDGDTDQHDALALLAVDQRQGTSTVAT